MEVAVLEVVVPEVAVPEVAVRESLGDFHQDSLEFDIDYPVTRRHIAAALTTRSWLPWTSWAEQP